MAKQDLVVKLMLDSGAFGNDLRQAERRAKDFSDNMRSAGKTAGDFGNEIGISAGALGKLGGVLSGAAGVVALVGAFKSVMESTHGSAKTFKSTIAGFEGVLETFQRSIANFDFTTFNKGMDEIFKRYKEWKKLQMEAAIANVAYDALFTRDINTFKDLELKFKGAKTQATRDSVRKEVRALLDEMRSNTQNYTDIVNDTFVASVIKGDSKISEGTIDSNKALTLMYQAMGLINNGGKNADIARYNDIVNEIRNIEYVLENGHVGLGTLDEAVGERALVKWVSDAHYAAWEAAKKERDNYANILENRDYYTKRKDDLIAENQDLFFRNQLYNLGEEELRGLLNQVQDAINKGRAISELELNFLGWTDPTQGGGTNAIKGSLAHYQEEIARMKKERDTLMKFESDEWKAQTEAIKKKQAALDAMLLTQKRYDGELEVELEIAKGSIAWYQEQIDEKEKLANSLNQESDEWKAVTAEIKEYTAALDALLEKYGEAIGKPVKKSGSTTSTKTDEPSEMEKMRGNILSLAEMRKNVEKGSEEWENLTAQIKAFIAEYAKMEKADSESDPLKKMVKKLANANMILASTVSVFDAMSEVFDLMEDKTGMIMSGITNMLSTFASTAMNLIQIQQAAIATNNAYATSIAAGEAAKLPYPANLAAIATVIATMVSVGAQIAAMAQKANKFAEGGIVGGTSYSGDKLFAMVNSGEMILNKRQQRNLGNMLGGGGGQVEFVISGDSLVGVLNNKNRKTNLTR
jgi:hypothetical protein